MKVLTHKVKPEWTPVHIQMTFETQEEFDLFKFLWSVT